MRKFVLGCACLVLLLGVFVALMFFWGGKVGTALQQEFFDALNSQNPKKVMALFHPALVEKVDEPILVTFMKAFRTNLGNFKSLSNKDFNTSVKLENGKKITDSTGTVFFDNGEAKSELSYVDGQIISFNVSSKKIENWFSGPASTELYRNRGEDFLRKLFDKPEEASYLMHEALQKKVSSTGLKNMSETLKNKVGGLSLIKYVSENVRSGQNYELVENYTVTCEKLELSGEIRFVFQGFKGEIIAFNVK